MNKFKFFQIVRYNENINIDIIPQKHTYMPQCGPIIKIGFSYLSKNINNDLPTNLYNWQRFVFIWNCLLLTSNSASDSTDLNWLFTIKYFFKRFFFIVSISLSNISSWLKFRFVFSWVSSLFSFSISFSFWLFISPPIIWFKSSIVILSLLSFFLNHL